MQLNKKKKLGKLLTVSQAAALFGVSESTIKRRCQSGKLEYITEKSGNNRAGFVYKIYPDQELTVSKDHLKDYWGHTPEITEKRTQELQAKGYTIAQIARELEMTDNAIRGAIKRILKKKLTKKKIGENVIPIIGGDNHKQERIKQDSRQHILIKPDSHAKRDVPNDRFTILGKYIAEVKPTVFVDLGDHFDMESLSGYEKGKKSFEGRRYDADIKAGVDGMNKLFAPIANSEIEGMETHFIIGNHEQRQDRAVDLDRMLEGTLSPDDFKLERHFQHIHKFTDIALIHNINMSHWFASGLMNRPIGGVNHARTLIQKLHGNAVQGHSHIFDLSFDVDPQGTRMFGLVAGCFLDLKQKETYVSERIQQLWWRGISEIFIGPAGDYSFKFTSLEELTEKFS